MATSLQRLLPTLHLDKYEHLFGFACCIQLFYCKRFRIDRRQLASAWLLWKVNFVAEVFMTVTTYTIV